MILIDKGIPIPPKSNCKYPWREMEIDDSFFLKATPKLKIKSLASQCNIAGKKYNRKYTIRTVQGGYRIWIVK